MAPQQITLEINSAHIRWRVWQIIPGFLSWASIIGLGGLAFVFPFWIAIFVIAYDIYILVRVVYMTIHLIVAYRHLAMHDGIRWRERCEGVSGNLSRYLKNLMIREKGMRKQYGKSSMPFRQIASHRKEVQKAVDEQREIIHWNLVHHLVVFPTFNESLHVLRSSLRALTQSSFPLERIHVAVGFEQRAGESASEKASDLSSEFQNIFGTFLTPMHPDRIPGEKHVKSANATWALKKLEEHVREIGVSVNHILVSNFDSDTVVPKEYFSYLTYVFIMHPNRYRVSYQPIPVYNNNMWDAPSFSRVIAMGSTFWQLIESTRPERLVTFSSHSMTLKALKDVGYWQTNVVSEDSRIFWQALLHYDGNYQSYPLYITVSMDAALAPTWFETLKNQYKQKRRWAFGIENFPYIAEGFLKNRKIALRAKALYLFRTLEGHYSWATAAIIVAGLGWLPVIFGGPEFNSTVLSYSLPAVTRTLMTLAMGGLLVSATISFVLMPQRPEQYSRLRYGFIGVQWLLVPIIATLLSAFPALDAETRLLLGRDLNFNVMEKTRRM